MKLLIIDHYAGGPGLGSRWQTWRLAQKLQEHGVAVTVLAADFSHKRRHNPAVKKDFEEQTIGGISYCFVGTPPYDNTLGGRGQNITAFIQKTWLNAKHLAQQYEPDAILCASAYPFDFFVARHIARYHPAKILFELRESWPVMMQALWGYAPGEIPVRISSFALDKALKNADKIFGVLPHGRNYLEERGIEAQTYLDSPEVTDLTPKSDELPQRSKEFADRIRSNHDFLIVYQGFIAEEKCLGTLVAAAATLEEKGVGVLICGNGGYKIQLKRLMREHDADNVYLMDRVEPAEVMDLYTLADCLYYGDIRASVGKYGLVSSKVLEYMLAAKPIVTVTAAPDTPATLAGCGINVGENNPRTLAETIEKLKELPDAKREKMGEKGPVWLREHHNAEALGERVYHVLKELIDG